MPTGRISSFFVHKIIAQAGPACDRPALFAVAGVTPDAPPDPVHTIEEQRYYALLEAIAETERPAIGFHMRTSGSMRPEEYGAVGLAWKSAPTLRQSFHRHDRYARLYNAVSAFATEDRGEEFLWTHHRPEPARPGLHLSNEAALGTYVALWRDAVGAPATPLRVQFAHRPVADPAPVEDFMGCQVIYGAEIDALVFSREQLDAPNRVGDETIWRFFQSHLDETYPDISAERIDQAVMIKIADNLSEGVPTLEETARALGLGARTLQRRLSEAGRTYQSLVEEARRALALKLVAEDRYPLVQVAFLAGFAEQSSFTRAFRRWSGVTPRAYRSGVRP
ncbi:MAG: AraC family transcriptional regulator [Oceanicaulis sp.]